jgi:hypothetical protein
MPAAVYAGQTPRQAFTANGGNDFNETGMGDWRVVAQRTGFELDSLAILAHVRICVQR